MAGDHSRLFGFQAITGETAQQLFAAWQPHAVVSSIESLSGGMSTSNYLVRLADSFGKYVLRIYPFNNDHCQLEAAAYAYANTRMRVPEVYAVDDRQRIIPHAYLIMEFLDGLTLTDYIVQHRGLAHALARDIGASLAALHRTTHPQMGLLDETLRFKQRFDSLPQQYEALLNGLAGSHISPITNQRMRCFLQDNPDMLERIAARHVFSHGDFNFSNILVLRDQTVAFIDFEYCFAAPVFYDIGKFFRTRTQVEAFMTPAVIAAFSVGYNDQAAEVLPHDWYRLAKLTDVLTMLYLINRSSIPDGWGESIDGEIVQTLALLHAA